MSVTIPENADANRTGTGKAAMRVRLRRFLISVLCGLMAALFTGTAVMASKENTYNMLLIGSDRRDSSWNGNSDTMILITVNYDSGQIYLTSFMRDLYADIPGVGGDKLNRAYAVGGAELLAETLESNYGVRIDNYMAVDFVQMAEIVDEMGGADVEVREDELESVNSGAAWMEETYGLDSGDALTSAGMQHLNGAQTVSFCRIRYVGDNDYERTSRQRRVLTSLREKSNALGTLELELLVTKVLSMSDNNVGLTDTVKVVKVVNDARNWVQVENRVPYDGMFVSEGEVLKPTDMEATREKLSDLIYGEDDSAQGNYTVTIGNDADTIKAVQQALSDAGYDCGGVDGYMGGRTAQAIMDYQKAHGLEESGMIDQALLEALGITIPTAE